MLKKPNLFQLRRDLLSFEKSYMMNLSINRAAFSTLKKIEQTQGKKLSKRLIAECDTYASEVLGNKKYAPWLYVYTILNDTFKEGWISENYYYDNVVIKDGSYSDISDLKPLTTTLLKTNYLPDLLYVKDNIFIKPITFEVLSKEEAEELLFEDAAQVIYKSDNSKQGTGVSFIDSKQWKEINFTEQSGVIQKIIQQNSIFNKLFPHPGATIRLTTVIDKSGEASVRAAYLRLGRNSENVISKHVVASTNIRVGINLKNGMLYKHGHTTNLDMIKYHPDTEVKFDGVTIPNFSKVCAQVEELHMRFPFVSCIGWDVSVDENESLQIMEWNTGNNGITYHEIIDGPCFPDLIS